MTIIQLAQRGTDVPLPWVRLDTAFPFNPKLLAMIGEKDGYRAGIVFVCSLSYSGGAGSDGFVPREALRVIHGRMCDANRLVKHGFWEEQPGGWLIHDWDQYQPSSEEMRLRRERAQRAARIRWHRDDNGSEP